jgi:hypothetical protein
VPSAARMPTVIHGRACVRAGALLAADDPAYQAKQAENFYRDYNIHYRGAAGCAAEATTWAIFFLVAAPTMPSAFNPVAA